MRTELVSIKSSSFKQLPPSSWIDEYNKILTMLSEREENFSGEELMDLVVTYQRLGIKRALTICKKRGLYSLSSSWIDLWVEIATSMGTMSELNEAMKYKVESVEAQRVRRFYNHLHRKDFAAAKVELDSITVPALKSKLSIILYVTQQDCVQLQKITKELISRGLGSENLVMPLLIIAERTGDKKALAQAFALAKKLDDANDANSFGYVSTVLEVNMKRAYQLINKAVKAEPENGAYLDSMAYWHYKMKNYSEAQKWMNKALDNIQIHYEIGTMLYHAGEIALALNQVECAKKYFLLALKNKDDDPSLDVKKVEQALEALKNK